MDELTEVVKEFLVESYENLDRLDQEFVALEKDPHDKETLSSIFRAVHTIKGACGFLGFAKLEKLAHAGENLLSKLREGTLLLNADITTALLATIDGIRNMLKNIESTGSDGEDEHQALIAHLGLLQEMQGQGTSGTAEATVASMPSEEVSVSVPAMEETTSVTAPTTTPTISAAAPFVASPAEAEHRQDRPGASSVAEASIRVDVSLLDKLMNLVGELVLSRNQILQFTIKQSESDFLATSQRLNLITSELQESVMKTRMQPILNVWNKFPRVVRDLAHSLGKKVEIVMEGKETEIDRSIIEAIKDPLTHLVRNTVDHGIEKPEIRKERGKPEEGTLLLRAYHEGGQVNIEITDDGNGIDVEKVKKKATERNLFSAEQLARMGEKELTNLIFMPGFSTAEKITNVSGRGVGMDVVKTNIEKIGGVIDLQNRPGNGTTIRIKIPLTLAIIPALVVTSGEDRYAIPQVSLVELVRLEEGTAEGCIEVIQGVPIYRLRGNLLPLVYLGRALETMTTEELDHKISTNDAFNIVILQAEGTQFGLIVDKINDTQEIVVKPLSKLLKGISAFAGATIMGDGKVALILDATGLAEKAGVVSDNAMGDSLVKSMHADSRTQDRQSLLLARLGQTGQIAIPLNLVARLEEFPVDNLEFAGDKEVVQYRGHVMPLVRLSKALGHPGGMIEEDPDRARLIQVVVYADGARGVGLVVDKISDIIEDSFVMQNDLHRPGIKSTAIIQGNVTEIIDVEEILQVNLPDYFAEKQA